MDPIQEFVQFQFGIKKEATPGWLSNPTVRTMGIVAGTAVAAPLAGMALGGLADATKGLYNAVTKKRDFNKMIEFNDDIRHMHKQDPKLINASFSTLRNLNPTFSRDPLVAGAFVRNLAHAPEGAFASANTALSARMPESMAQQGYMGGISAGITRGYEAALDETPEQQRAGLLSNSTENARRAQIIRDMSAGTKAEMVRQPTEVLPTGKRTIGKKVLTGRTIMDPDAEARISRLSQLRF